MKVGRLLIENVTSYNDTTEFILDQRINIEID
jgi:hypothetical protein